MKTDVAAEQPQTKSVLLALQGGATLGAYTSGVLDYLLEDGRLEFEGISGASAGAVNTAVTAYGLLVGGPEGARAHLQQFWYGLSEACATRRRPWYSGIRFALRMLNDHTSSASLNEAVGRLLMSFDFDPKTMDPLRQALTDVVDFERLRSCTTPKLFVNATDVRTNQSRIFSASDVSADAVMASACIPLLFEPVRIDGQYYWDGGYMGNPALYPLIYECECSDIVLIQNNPISVAEPPRNARQILERLSEVSFVSTLLRELRMIDFVSGLVASGEVKRPGLRVIRMHMVEAPQALYADQGEDVFNTNPERLDDLRAIGRESGKSWIDRTYADIGQKSTLHVTWYTNERTDIPIGGPHSSIPGEGQVPDT